MCGIAGEINYRGNIKENIAVYNNMQKTLTRRGPDQKDIYLTDKAALIHARLAVIDIENGRQPMHYKTDSEEYTIVYNGELYNTYEIRKKLVDKGYVFKGYSDTETVLYAFCEWGEKALNYFNGIFAFAIWMNKQEKLFIARDRIGVKPLFYSVGNDWIVFGSEIKTLLQNDKIKPIINKNSIMEIMLIGPGRTPGYGVFKQIKELKPGEFAYFTKNGIKKETYWFLKDFKNNDTFEQTVEKIRHLLCDSIKRQMISDVPLCTFLSGGLDSSIISSVVAREYAKQGVKLDTFTIEYKDNDKYFKKSKFQPNSDTEYTGLMSKYINSESHVITIDTNELVNALYASVEARDIPGMVDVDSSLLLFCKEIKKTHTVALSGECSDEIFGGYPWYRDKDIRMTEGFPWSQSTRYRAEFIQKNICRSETEATEYVMNKYNEYVNASSKMDDITPLESRMKEMVNLNFYWFMQTLLDRKDRMSMYNGLEVRVPFCDYRIAEYLYTVPWEYKDYKGYEKGLLREAMKDFLPDEILWRKKSPYPKTHNPSYLKKVSEILKKIIDKNDSPMFEFVNRQKLASLLNDSISQPWYGQLMTTPQTIAYFIQIDYWMRKYKITIE